MDLGVQIEPQFGFKFADVLAIATDAEAAGFSRLWVSDHLFLDADATAKDCLEAWTLLAALAVRTDRIRIGPMVTSQSYRNPALLAKMAADVDVMSGGRLDFGVGAGWKEIEYRAYGYDFPDAPTRVTQLVETLEICTRMWKEERATYRGKHYRIENALCSPKPAQRPLPIWIGGSKPRVMRIAAKYAHAFNLNVSASAPAELPDRLRDLDEACASVKRDPKTLLRSTFLIACVAKTRERADALLDQLASRQKMDRAAFLGSRPGLVFGTPDDALPRLRSYASRGIAHANIMFQPYGSEREQIGALAAIATRLG
ncbi:MAG: TIGR03560 family F420-dependent LLM class oxidoreductase [Chloroflexi bacterium]|nr:MAG: TIGR03560 family F420-dependent LLM class oxidoreductase [Chloroflexota bacterium]